MRIYKMTATFGKLEHAELSLELGLNVITAPNEWGKSTWCAFLVAMLYGLDTRAKTTKNTLADIEMKALAMGMVPRDQVETRPVTITVPEVQERVLTWDQKVVRAWNELWA